MGDIEAGLESNLFLLTGTTLIIIVILLIFYEYIFGSEKEEDVKYQAESDKGKKWVYLALCRRTKNVGLESPVGVC